MSRYQLLPGLTVFRTEPLRANTLRDEPDWVLVERITGKKCPETVNLRALSRMTETELTRTLGLSDSQGKKLGAALVLADRLAHEGIERGDTIRSAKDVFPIFAGEAKDAKKEGFYAVTLDQKHRVIDLHRISEGTLSMSPVHPREAFNPIIRDSAAAVVFVHNHPSGNPEPSEDDRLLTARLAGSGNLLGIRVLDHVVIGDGCFVSLRDRGAIPEVPRVGQAAETEYAGGVEESNGKDYGGNSSPFPSGSKTRESFMKKTQETRPDFIVEDPPNTHLTFEFGSGVLKYMDVTLSSDDWNKMVENAARGYTGHLLEKQEDGVSVLLRSYKGTGEERTAALNDMFRLNHSIPESENRAPYSVIDHSHFERAFPEEPPLQENDKTLDQKEKGISIGTPRTFLVAPREKTDGSSAPDYTGLVVIGKTAHKVDLWKDGQIQIARLDTDRFISVGSGRLSSAGPGELSGPIPVQTAPDVKTSVELGIRGIGNGTPIHLSISEGRSERTIGRSQKPKRGISR